MSGHRRLDFLTGRIARVSCVAALLATAFVGFTASPAAAGGRGTITGIVTAAAGGAPVRGVCVFAHLTDIDSTLVKSTSTAVNGRYTLDVPAGPLNVQFSDTGLCPGGIAGTLAGEWYNNQPSLTTAIPVSVGSGATRPNINAALNVGGAITGTVTAAAGGAPLQRICVAAFTPGSNPLILVSVSTAKNGTYKLTGVPAGNVLVEFSASGICPGGAAANFALQWFNGKATSDTADVVSVTAAGTHPGINAALAVGGIIRGIAVNASAHNAGLFGICVTAFTTGLNGGVPVASTGSVGNGKYTLRGVPGGAVQVRFDSLGFCPGGVVQHFATQWYSNKPSSTVANPVNVVAGATTGGINAAMVSLVPLSKPGAPRSIHASKPSPKKAAVTWAAPAKDGGTPITGYEVTFGAKTSRVSASAKQATFAGLPKGSYHFRVRALNALGSGAWSGPSNRVRIT